ncbi:MAG: hypothetical protein RL172_990 [Bacteroidota bacterium]|jgi:hypothetical protein
MKIVKTSWLIVAAVASSFSSMAQTADEVINKHIEAIGGKEKLSAITSVKMERTLQIMGNDAPATTIILNGKGYRNESEFGGQKMVEVITDKGGWAINPMMGSADPQPMADAQYQAGKGQLYAVPLLNYQARGEKASLLGQEKVGDANTYKIQLTDNSNQSTTYFIDASSYYIVQTVKTADMMGQSMDLTTTYSGFKKTDYGWVVAENIEMSFGGQFSLTGKTTKTEINSPVDAAIFQMK